MSAVLPLEAASWVTKVFLNTYAWFLNIQMNFCSFLQSRDLAIFFFFKLWSHLLKASGIRGAEAPNLAAPTACLLWLTRTEHHKGINYILGGLAILTEVANEPHSWLAVLVALTECHWAPGFLPSCLLAGHSGFWDCGHGIRCQTVSFAHRRLAPRQRVLVILCLKGVMRSL